MKPLAPGRASTITCWPQVFDSRSAIRRMNTAGPAPAEYGATTFTTFVGYCWPWAAAQHRQRSAARDIRVMFFYCILSLKHERGADLKFSFFHLMPYTHLELESHDWPFPNRYFDATKA